MGLTRVDRRNRKEEEEMTEEAEVAAQKSREKLDRSDKRGFLFVMGSLESAE